MEEFGHVYQLYRREPSNSKKGTEDSWITTFFIRCILVGIPPHFVHCTSELFSRTPRISIFRSSYRSPKSISRQWPKEPERPGSRQPGSGSMSGPAFTGALLWNL